MLFDSKMANEVIMY